MSRTVGALGKAKYIGVSLAKLNEMFGANQTIYVSAEHYAGILGVNLATAPRQKTVVLGAENPGVSLGNVGVMENPVISPVTNTIVIPAKPEEKTKVEEKAEAQVIDMSEY